MSNKSLQSGTSTNNPQSAFRNPQSIAIVGASARAAAFSVLRSGRLTVAADLFADADLAQHCSVTRISSYPEGFVSWLAKTECDGWFYTGALENHPAVIDRLAKLQPLLGNAGDVLRRCRDPMLLQEMLPEHDLHFPETRAKCDDLSLDGSWLCKKYRGSSGSGVWELADERARQRADAHAVYFQQRVAGRPASAVFALSENWTKTLGVTSQWVGASVCSAVGFQYVGSLGIQHEISSSLSAQLEKLSQVLARRLRLRGLVGADLMLDGGRMWVIEINPRYTASVEILERTSGDSAIEEHIAACLGVQSTIRQRDLPEQKHGKAILYAKQDVIISEEFFRWSMSQAGISLTSGLADIPTVGSRIPLGRPVLTVFASGVETCLPQLLKKRIAEVESRLYRSFGQSRV